MIHSNTTNRSHITALTCFDEKNSLNPVGSKKDVDELRKALKSSQKLIVKFSFFIY